MASIEQITQSKLNRIGALQEEVAMLGRLAERLPNLQDYRTSVGTVPGSPGVNSLASDFHRGHDCSSCDRAHPLTVLPYTELEGHRLYTVPSEFTVAEPYGVYSDGTGFQPCLNWERPMRAAGISEVVISKIAEFLELNPPTDSNGSSQD